VSHNFTSNLGVMWAIFSFGSAFVSNRLANTGLQWANEVVFGMKFILGSSKESLSPLKDLTTRWRVA
jgi:hypothetical protein